MLCAISNKGRNFKETLVQDCNCTIVHHCLLWISTSHKRVLLFSENPVWGSTRQEPLVCVIASAAAGGGTGRRRFSILDGREHHSALQVQETIKQQCSQHWHASLPWLWIKSGDLGVYSGCSSSEMQLHCHFHRSLWIRIDTAFTPSKGLHHKGEWDAWQTSTAE